MDDRGADATQDDWSNVKQTFHLEKAPEQTRTQVLTAATKEKPMDLLAETQTFGTAIVKDLFTVAQNSSDWRELLQQSWTVLTFGNRGVILGCALIIISLTLMALMPPVALLTLTPLAKTSGSET